MQCIITKFSTVPSSTWLKSHEKFVAHRYRFEIVTQFFVVVVPPLFSFTLKHTLFQHLIIYFQVQKLFTKQQADSEPTLVA